jgi:hypothetical protein
LLQTAKLDAEPLTRFMLGGGRRSGCRWTVFLLLRTAGPRPVHEPALERCSIDLFQGQSSRRTNDGSRRRVRGLCRRGRRDFGTPPPLPCASPSFNWFDYDLTASISFPATFRGTDFDNDRATGFTYNNFLFTRSV